MTPLPKKKSTRGRTGRRRNNKPGVIPNLVACPNCKALKYPHKACGSCGYHHSSAK